MYQTLHVFCGEKAVNCGLGKLDHCIEFPHHPGKGIPDFLLMKKLRAATQ